MQVAMGVLPSAQLRRDGSSVVPLLVLWLPKPQRSPPVLRVEPTVGPATRLVRDVVSDADAGLEAGELARTGDDDVRRARGALVAISRDIVADDFNGIAPMAGNQGRHKRSGFSGRYCESGHGKGVNSGRATGCHGGRIQGSGAP